MIYRLLLFAVTISVISCKKDIALSKIKGHRNIAISDSLETNAEIDAFIAPYKARVNKDLDSVLAFSKGFYSKTDGELNTAIGNMMADAVFKLSEPVFKQRTGKNIDMVLLNHGGIRSTISKGQVTSRTAYKLMPFENSIVVTPMKGRQMQDMLDYLAKSKRAHPISQLHISLNEDYSLKSATIKDKDIDPKKTYYVATNDYLYKGGNNMTFLKSKDTVYNLNYKIRNILIDYFKSIDTLQPQRDNRFIRLNPKT